jgi:hypothetical protein
MSELSKQLFFLNLGYYKIKPKKHLIRHEVLGDLWDSVFLNDICNTYYTLMIETDRYTIEP